MNYPFKPLDYLNLRDKMSPQGLLKIGTKVSNKVLLTLIESLIREAIEEAGPIGYLSKTKRPDPKTAWDPKAQAEWEKQQGIPGQSQPSPLSEPSTEKTVAPMGKIQKGREAPEPLTVAHKTELTPPPVSSPVGPAPVTQEKPPTTAEISSMLQQATEDELKQIRAILQKGKPLA